MEASMTPDLENSSSEAFGETSSRVRVWHGASGARGKCVRSVVTLALVALMGLPLGSSKSKVVVAQRSAAAGPAADVSNNPATKNSTNENGQTPSQSKTERSKGHTRNGHPAGTPSQ